MRKATYEEMPNLLYHLQEFKGNSVMGAWTSDLDTGRRIYEVYSYSTLIAQITYSKELVYFDNCYYSQTTSKLQNILIDMFDTQEVEGRYRYSRGRALNNVNTRACK